MSSFPHFWPAELISQRDQCIAEKQNCPVEAVMGAEYVAEVLFYLHPFESYPYKIKTVPDVPVETHEVMVVEVVFFSLKRKRMSFLILYKCAIL